MTLPDFEADHLVQRFFLTLEKTQRQSPQAIRRYQHQLLEKLVRHAAANVPFYRDSGRLSCLFDANGNFRPEAWPDVAVLTRSEAQANQDALHAERVPAEMKPLREEQTSGATGAPLAVRQTSLSRVVSRGLLGRALAWHGHDDVGPIAVTATGGLTFGSTVSGQPGKLRAGQPFAITIDMPLADQMDLLEAARPTHVLGYPNQILNWIGAKRRSALQSIRCAITTGEVLRPEAKFEITRAIGATVIDVYSGSETGPIAVSGRSGGYRVAEENVFLEADSDGAELQPVTVTPFYNYGTPLIRYRPGDMIERVRPGRGAMPGLRRLGRIIGRERNLLVRRDGSRFWPDLAARRMSRILTYHGWQVTQDRPGQAEMSIIVDPSTPQERIEALRAMLVSDILKDFELTIRPVDTIETGLCGGKTYEAVFSRALPPL